MVADRTPFPYVRPAPVLGFPEQRQSAARGDDDTPAIWFADTFKGGEHRDQSGYVTITLDADSGERSCRIHHSVDMQPDALRNSAP